MSLVLFSRHSQIIGMLGFLTGYRCGTRGVLQGHSEIARPLATRHREHEDVRDGSRRSGHFPTAALERVDELRITERGHRSHHNADQAQPCKYFIALVMAAPTETFLVQVKS